MQLKLAFYARGLRLQAAIVYGNYTIVILICIRKQKLNISKMFGSIYHRMNSRIKERERGGRGGGGEDVRIFNRIYLNFFSPDYLPRFPWTDKSVARRKHDACVPDIAPTRVRPDLIIIRDSIGMPLS